MQVFISFKAGVMALTVAIKVVPSSGKNTWQINKDGKLKCFLKSAPEVGAANKELIKTLAKQLGIRQQEVEIAQGLTDRNKLIKMHVPLTYEAFLEKLGLAQQLTLLS